MKHSKLLLLYSDVSRLILVAEAENSPAHEEERKQRKRENGTEVAKSFSAKQKRTEVHKSLELQFNKFGLEGIILCCTIAIAIR